MQPTSDRAVPSTAPADRDRRGAAETDAGVWQPPFEADPADAQEQSREMIDDVGDPEAPTTSPQGLPDLDLSRASEADLAEQLYEVPYDDDDADR